jgi:hypothetical protein
VERQVLARAGLDVAGLEAEGRLVVRELDPLQPPEAYGADLEVGFAAALARGLTAMWYARFAVGADVAGEERVLVYDRHYHARFDGRPVVTLCPFIVGELAPTERAAGLAELHEAVAVPDGEGFSLLRP